ncbi:MAG: hypothetical protein ACTHKC_08890, partial [Candidatus Nitrosocosmicus sp.]
MKAVGQLIVCFFIFQFSYGQGTITSTDMPPRAGIENTFLYHPPKHLIVPKTVYASIVYNYENHYYNKIIPIHKVDSNKYQFLFKAPDSTQSFIFIITDSKKNMIDNNNDNGFVIYLYDQNDSHGARARVATADLLSYYAPRILKLDKRLSTRNAIKLYEEAYKLSPTLKKENSYTSYLFILYEEKKDTVKSMLLAYAKKMAAENDEQKCIDAINIYGLLKMNNEKEKVEKKVLERNPVGKLAIRKFWDKFYSNEKPTEQTILSSMNDYINQFKDTSIDIKDAFYANIISYFLAKKDWDGIKKYELLVKDKFRLTY